MITNELPASQTPYKLEAGEGLRYAFGSQLATIIAGPNQLGQAASGIILTGAKGSLFPAHQHSSLHEALFVVDGVISLALAGKTYLLTSGDYVNIPPGTPHSYKFVDHRGKLLSWSFGGNSAAIYAQIGKPFTGTVYPACSEQIDWKLLDRSGDVEILEEKEPADEQVSSKLTTSPESMVPFVLAAGEGERMIAGDQLYTILGNQSHSDGVFISLLTEGPIGRAIPRHQHERVTELFYCLDGAMEMFAGDGFISLHPGDFLHVPPRTPHSFQLKKHDTRFIGFITPGDFEPFFRYLCVPFDGYRYPLAPHPFSFERVIEHLSELDLTILERPGGPPPA